MSLPPPEPVYALSNTAENAETNNNTPQQGQLFGVFGGGALIGDGETSYNEFPVPVLTPSGGGTAGWVPVLNGTGGYVWQAQSGGGGGGGGSSTVTEVANLGNATATLTCTDPTTYGIQVATLTAAACTITPPTATAGDSFRLVLIDGVGTPSAPSLFTIAGSVDYWSGSPVANGATNVLQFYCVTNGTWIVQPETSGATAIAALAVTVTGGATGMSTVRFVGMQTEGTQPTYASPATGDCVWDDGFTGGTLGLWLYNGTSWISLTSGGGGGGGLSFANSPGPYGATVLNRGSSEWLYENPRYVDVTAEFGVSTSATDNSSNLNSAFHTLGQLGLIAWLPAGTYAIQNPLVIGNGSGSAASTWACMVEGATPPQGVSDHTLFGNLLESYISYTGAGGLTTPLLEILGPIQNVGLKNLHIDGSAYASGARPLVAMNMLTSRFAVIQSVAITGCINGFYMATQNGGGAGNGNSSFNRFTDFNVQYHGQTTAAALPTGGSNNYSYGVLLSYISGGGGNSCYNDFDNLNLSTTGTGTTYSLALQGCDSNRFYGVDLGAKNATYGMCLDYSYGNGSDWPAGNILRNVEFGGVGASSSVKQIGSPATLSSAMNRILGVSTVNGYTPNPQLSQLAWDNEHLSGQAQLNGTTGVAVSGNPVEFANFLGSGGNGSVRVWYTQQPTNPGALYGVYASSTLKLYSTNASDTATVGWEIVP